MTFGLFQKIISFSLPTLARPLSPDCVNKHMGTIARFFRLELNRGKPDVRFTMMGSADDGVQTRQHQVQRLLGQCLLRLNAYERLMKAIVAHHEISGSPQSLGDAQAIRSTDIGRKTLGTLVNHLLESFLTSNEMQMSSENQLEPLTNGTTFGVRIHLGLSPDDFTQVENGLKEIMLLRNNLVHHFLEWHDPGSLDGCGAAEAALIEASGQIKHHFDELRQWAEELERIRLHAAEVIRADPFRDFVVKGTIPWPFTAIVGALQEAFVELARDGWAPIAEASDWVAARYPGELHANYGCRTWRQVIHESGIFELRYVQTERQRVGLYRIRGHVL